MDTSAKNLIENYNQPIKIVLIFIFVMGVTLFSDKKIPGSADPELDSQWQEFKEYYQADQFGDDGYFVRAIRNGHGLFYQTHEFAWRFTRKTAESEKNNCGSCHSPEELAYSFATSDRFDKALGKRVSFEERIMRCYVSKLDGFVPTIYDPAIRDIRIFTRMVAHNLKINEGSRPGPVIGR